MTPSAKASSSTIDTSNVTCCHLPRGSVNRKSTYFTSWSLIACRTSLGRLHSLDPLRVVCRWSAVRWRRARSRRCGCGSPPRRWIQRSCHRRCGRSGPRGRSPPPRARRSRRRRRPRSSPSAGSRRRIRRPGRVRYAPSAARTPSPLVTVMPCRPTFLKGLLHVVELERLDDRLDFLHRRADPFLRAPREPNSPREGVALLASTMPLRHAVRIGSSPILAGASLNRRWGCLNRHQDVPSLHADEGP